MADIPLQDCVFTDAALTPASAGAAAGDTIPIANGERVILEVTNGSGSSITVTIAPAKSTVNVKDIGPVTVPSRTVSVGAGATKRIGPIPPGYVGASGKAAITYSATTDVTRAAFRVPTPA